MPFNPKEAWASIGRLTGGESIHHTSPKVIKTRIPSGNLAENDKENVSVFANHFKTLLNNHKTTDTTVINKINLQEIMEELDDPPCGQSTFVPYMNLPTTNQPVSTAFPRTPSSPCQRKTYATTSTSSPSSWRTKSTLKNGTKAKKYQYLRADTYLTPTTGEE